MKSNLEATETQRISKRKKGVIKAKSDFFRSARYGLTLQEHRIIYYAILAGQQDGRPFEPVTLSVSAFRELFDVKGENYYSEFQRISQSLIERSVNVSYKDNQDGSQHFLRAAWLKGIDYNAKEGSITISPNEMLKPFFEGKPFSTSEYYFLIRFSSQYAERLYELLKSFNYKSVADFKPDDLARRLAAPPSCLKNYKDFRRRVLEPAIKDINEFTDLDVDFREKRGMYNKVNIVFFSITKKRAPQHAELENCGKFGFPLPHEGQACNIQETLEDKSLIGEIPGQLLLDGNKQ